MSSNVLAEQYWVLPQPELHDDLGSKSSERLVEDLPDGAFYDVIIVGAGISGIGAAYYLSKECPDKTCVILDSLDGLGGTWLTHRYPGVRTDSDRYTYGFSFKPWKGAPVATGPEILEYLREVVDENSLDGLINYRHRVDAAEWSSDEKQWTLDVTRLSDQKVIRLRTNFLYMGQGFYRHDKGYMPQWPEMDSFKGRIVHPQHWPDDLSYEGKDVVIIGSGAAAASLIPAMADQCQSLTMVQRSPTYYHPGHYAFDTQNELEQLGISDGVAHDIVRRKILHKTALFNARTFEEPDAVREELIDSARQLVGDKLDVGEHFTPRYRPWQQRLAFIPNGNTLRAFRDGKATLITDHIKRFTPTGLELTSGATLKADVIISATGFELCMMGNIRFTVDGRAVNFADTVTFRSMLFTELPNLVWAFGYFRAAWTPRSELIAEFVCKLLNHMTANRWKKLALRSPTDMGIETVPWITDDNFNSGYLKRGQHLLPKQAAHEEWYQKGEYLDEERQFDRLRLDAPYFIFS